MQLTSFFTALVAAISIAGTAYSRPAGAPDGVYLHVVDSNGKEHLQYLGAFNSTVVARSADASTGPVCQNIEASSSDIANAESMLEAAFGGGRRFTQKISAYSGNAVAFGCDYGNGQTMSSGEYSGYMQVLDAKCGNNFAAYYDLPSSKSSYGRTNSDQDFC